MCSRIRASLCSQPLASSHPSIVLTSSIHPHKIILLVSKLHCHHVLLSSLFSLCPCIAFISSLPHVSLSFHPCVIQTLCPSVSPSPSHNPSVCCPSIPLPLHSLFSSSLQPFILLSFCPTVLPSLLPSFVHS